MNKMLAFVTMALAAGCSPAHVELKDYRGSDPTMQELAGAAENYTPTSVKCRDAIADRIEIRHTWRKSRDPKPSWRVLAASAQELPSKQAAAKGLGMRRVSRDRFVKRSSGETLYCELWVTPQR